MATPSILAAVRRSRRDRRPPCKPGGSGAWTCRVDVRELEVNADPALAAQGMKYSDMPRDPARHHGAAVGRVARGGDHLESRTWSLPSTRRRRARAR